VQLAVSLVAFTAVVIAVASASRRFDLPEPLVLIALGMGASYLPFIPEVHLTSEVVLVGLLPPLLYATALQTSLVDFNTNRRAIMLLSIGLVAFTTVGVGLVVHVVVPGVSWPGAFALGAVVAPPDAVAATAIARRIGLPRRIVTILEGESLLNDATALVALRTAILAAAGSVSVFEVGLTFVVAAVGGALSGIVVYLVVGYVRKHFTDSVLDTSISLVTPFLAYVVAESVHASGVLAVVVSGLLLGHRAPILQTASSRIAERNNWRTVSFLLENSVFLLIGLQARWILGDVSSGTVPLNVVVVSCAVCLLAVIVLRLLWVFPARFLLVGQAEDIQEGHHPSWQHTTVLGWAGMRGVVTLAAAFAIPESFAKRDVLVLIALVVTAGTLFIQGLSLPWLVRRLRVPTPDPREDALARAGLFQKATLAGLEKLRSHEGEDDPHETFQLLQQRAEQRDFAAWERLGRDEPGSETPSEAYVRLRLEMLEAERAKVLKVRSTGAIPHEVVEDVLGALDVEESMLDVRVQRRDLLRASDQSRPVRGTTATIAQCEHLLAAPEVPEPPEGADSECPDCIEEGTRWVHLRKCLECGKVGCCDSSPGRHATRHFEATGHPVIQSAEPGEFWRWCFVDHRLG
jgi:CPA1 family monovalent cation:H+ antiporter